MAVGLRSPRRATPACSVGSPSSGPCAIWVDFFEGYVTSRPDHGFGVLDLRTLKAWIGGSRNGTCGPADALIAMPHRRLTWPTLE